MSKLLSYARTILARAQKPFVSCEVFAKVLTCNDDSGRHGVLIPSDAYPFFPYLPIPDPTENSTLKFLSFDSIESTHKTVAYKYYKRYPERRITRLPGILNVFDASPRILVFLRAKCPNGNFEYYFDCGNSSQGGRFDELFRLIFGNDVAPVPGIFVIRPIDSGEFLIDSILAELLEKFDAIKQQGWIDSLRTGDTGIGYTFETLLGIKENNDKTADFKGIEIKCKGVKSGTSRGGGKINIFQSGPTWLELEMTIRDRIRKYGKLRSDGLYSCNSQVTITPNNLGLLLKIFNDQNKINLCKNAHAFGYWTFDTLAKRLFEKHSRTAFVKAQVRKTKTKRQYAYEELVYCEKPSIERFINLIYERNIVFEFIMHEEASGSPRNHGYPWRLNRSELMDRLFAFQIKLR